MYRQESKAATNINTAVLEIEEVLRNGGDPSVDTEATVKELPVARLGPSAHENKQCQ